MKDTNLNIQYDHNGSLSFPRPAEEIRLQELQARHMSIMYASRSMPLNTAYSTRV